MASAIASLGFSLHASVALMRAVVAGEITPGEGQAVSAILEGHRKLVELADIERRVAALEKK